MSKLSSVFILASAILLLTGCATHLGKTAVETKTISSIEPVKMIGPDIGATRPLSSPRDIAINQKGEIYIADYGNDRIVKLDSSFSFVGEFGGFGSSGASLSGPISVALDNVSNLYVVDSGNSRILRLDSRLNFISTESGYSKDSRYFFDRPISIALSARGDIYIGDTGSGDCYKLDPFFNYIFDFGSRNSTSEIGRPSAIAIGEGNQVFVADSENGRVTVFDDFGILLRSLGQDILSKPVALKADKNGLVWVIDSQTRQLYCFNIRGQLLFSWPGQNNIPLNSPAGFCLANSGLIYLTDLAANRIIILKPIFGK
jgi:DNA-binding beta-propeller fold protein YncE